jgi:hypothetical protein
MLPNLPQRVSIIKAEGQEFAKTTSALEHGEIVKIQPRKPMNTGAT